jgi:hypothetical protein
MVQPKAPSGSLHACSQDAGGGGKDVGEARVAAAVQVWAQSS